MVFFPHPWSIDFEVSIKSWGKPVFYIQSSHGIFHCKWWETPHDLGWDMLGPLGRCDIIDRFFIFLGGSSASTGDPQAEDVNLEQNTRVLVA